MNTHLHTGLLCLLTLTTLRAAAQFDALPDSNASWITTFWIGPGYPYEGYYYSYDTAATDTLYGTEVFKKLSVWSSSGGSVAMPGGYGGALRDNGMGQVYFWEAGAPDPELLYDFDVLPGDTVHEVRALWAGDVRVEAVDTVVVNGTGRKRIAIGCLGQPGFSGGYWIQGIGGTGGLITTAACPSVSGTGALVCMTANDTVQYGDGVGDVGDCAILLGTSEQPAPRDGLSLWPVPAEGDLAIGGVQGELLIEVMAMNGRCMLRERSRTGRIDLSALAPGVHALRVTDDRGRVRTARFVKQ